MPGPKQPSDAPANGEGGQPTEGNQNQPQAGGDNNSGGQPQPQTNEPDLSKLEGDQLAKVLENPNLWKQPRIAELLQASKDLKTIKEQQTADEEKRLTESKKFEDLFNKEKEKTANLESQLQTATINQALSQALIKESVVDLDGALKLVDRSKVTVDENGQVKGVEEAMQALKTDKSYLFTAGGTKPTTVGAPSNQPNGQPGAPMKFKRSQLKDNKFYQEHRTEILEAQRLGLIEDDLGTVSQSV
jgi:beta-glucosidase-like glycosyl hydrolase